MCNRYTQEASKEVSSTNALAKRLQEQVEILLLDLQYICVECSVTCPCTTSLLCVKKCQTEFATIMSIIRFMKRYKYHCSLFPGVSKFKGCVYTDDQVRPVAFIETSNDKWQAFLFGVSADVCSLYSFAHCVYEPVGKAC